MLHEKCYLYFSKNMPSLFSGEVILLLFNLFLSFTYYQRKYCYGKEALLCTGINSSQLRQKGHYSLCTS